jgi:hypothetical protein
MQGNARQCKAMQGNARQCKAMQGNAGKGKARQVKARQGERLKRLPPPHKSPSHGDQLSRNSQEQPYHADITVLQVKLNISCI